MENRRDFLVGDAARLAWIGAGAAALLLLVGCANLLNLMLVRGLERAHELQVRSALGASRARVMGSLLLEGLVIGAAGALSALVVGRALVLLVVRFGPGIPRSGELPLAGRPLALTIVVAATCAVLWLVRALDGGAARRRPRRRRRRRRPRTRPRRQPSDRFAAVRCQRARPLTYAAVATSLVVIAWFASWIPAARAAGVDPASALRQD